LEDSEKNTFFESGNIRVEESMKQLMMNGQDVSERLLAFASELVRTRSFSGDEEQVIQLIAATMTTLGYDEVRIDRFGNLMGRVGHGEKVILFDSHVDTVTVTDEALWEVPPFSGEIRDGFVWGRGSVDMKGGLAASVFAGALAKSQGWLEGKTVYVTCTLDEEYCDGEALRHVLEECQIRPDFAVICEPSSNQIALGHKGKAQVIIRTQGVSAHGSAPEKGVNAVYEMAEIIQRVERTNLALSRQEGNHGTLVLARISSTGVSLNAVPSECEIYLDRRIGLGETEQAIRDEMDQLTSGKKASWQVDVIRRKTWTGEELVYEPLHTAWKIDLEHELVRAIRAAYGEVFGQSPQNYEFWDFSTNAVAVIRLGVPTIGFGPGKSKLAHMRNERCPVDEIVDACAVYAEVIRKTGG
jgi:putative selenium metabolism hydrolase